MTKAAPANTRKSMDDRVLTPDDAQQRLAAWKGRIDRLAADTKAMSDRFQQLEVTAKDPRGMAEVTVDSTGALVGLRLTQEIERSAPDVVAATIMDTVRTARADLAQRTQTIIEETVGTDSAAGRAIAERVGQQLRGEPAEPTAGDVRAAGDEDEDNDDLNIWR